MRLMGLMLAAAALAGCAAALHGGGMAAAPAGPVGETASADVVNGAGAVIGRASFAEGPRGVLIRLELNEGALPAGWHGAHIHAAGDCSDFAAGFKAAGAHAGHAPQGAATNHGLLNPDGPEQGDLANIYAPASGPIAAELYAPGVTLAAAAIDGRLPLRGPQGASLILHANADDHRSQPIGGAGARLACAALR